MAVVLLIVRLFSHTLSLFFFCKGSEIKPTIILIAILVPTCLLCLIIRHVVKVILAGKYMKNIEQASLKVRLATFGRLEKRYESEYGPQASTLAVAITNLLFSDVFPDDSPAKVLLETQGNTIEK